MANTRWADWFPILRWSRGYGRQQLAGDATAAAVVTLLLIPQSLAYALLAGMPAGANEPAVEFEEVGVGQLPRRGVLQQRLQPFPRLEQPQLQQQLAESFQLARVHATSSSCSYTSRSRTSTPCTSLAARAGVDALKRVRALRVTAPGPCAGSTCT